MKKRVSRLMPLLVMFSMQAMDKQKKKKTSSIGNNNTAHVTLDKWKLKHILEQRQTMKKKATEEMLPTRNDDNKQVTPDKWALKKFMKHATYNGEWKVVSTQIFRNKK